MDAISIKQLINKLNGHCAKVLETAAGFAASRQHYEVLPEHFLLKLMEEGNDGDMQRALHYFQVDQDAIWRALLDFIHGQRAGNPGKPVFSKRLFDWLERSWLSANVKQGEDWITGAALLDALLDLVPYGPVLELPELLSRVDGHFLSANLNKICKQSSERCGSVAQQQSNDAGYAAQGDALSAYCEDLTAKAQNDKLDPVLGRNDEIRMAIDVLCRRRKNNPILVGDPGVGKTAVVEGLAQRIQAGQVPTELQGVRIMVLDMGLLQAGAGVKGEFERRLKQVIDEVKNAATPIILFIDEAHTLIGAGGDAGMSDAANLLKPALARGELRTIAATTWSEFKQYFERDAALERRFQMIKVDEPSEQAAQLMLSGLKERYQRHHQVFITDAAIAAAVTLSARYVTGRQLPDKAIDVLDTAAAKVRMSAAVEPSDIESQREHIRFLEHRLTALNIEASRGIVCDEALLRSLDSELLLATQRLQSLEAQHQAQLGLLTKLLSTAPDDLVQQQQLRAELKAQGQDGNAVYAQVDADVVASVIAQWTGVPVGNMVRDQLSALLSLEQVIGQEVIGQTEALGAIAQTLRVSKAGVSSQIGPLGVFLLAGPSGVGKTETARCIARSLFGGEKFLTTINMSEYQEAHTVSQLKGSPPGYVGYGEGGVLTEAVRQRPYSVVLLDEVEKAHPDIMNLFYQVFERGVMRDGEGREIDFKNTVIIMTSNLGANTILEACEAPALNVTADETEGDIEGVAPINNAADWQRPTLGELSQLIRPELLARFAPALLARMQVVPFYPLEGEALKQIVALKLALVAERLQANHQMQLRVDAQVLEALAERCRLSDSGARLVSATLEQQVLPGIAKSILGFLAEDDVPDILTLTLDDAGQICADFADINH
ncbi:type VI secretion system ATPase TssH [Pseudoalteromonas fenneropenaei]|uniref:Type VI secretion system ATPase TssH n=1 Tax=Pseudoalteromonas fenneropenaei TaxID=1737459 RepID=A0ABV7CHW9_9GAMM